MANLELANPPDDMSLEERKAVHDFMTDGCPGIGKVQDSDHFRWFELYMSGKTYAEIATITKWKKDTIMFIAYKSKWMEKRLKHYEDISQHMLAKVQAIKLDSANNMMTIISALGKYCQQKYDRYLVTNDPDVVEGMDQKIVTQYFKSIDLLHKLLNNGAEDEDGVKKPQSVPMVNINMGSGTIRQIDAKTLEISDETAGDLVKALASLKKSNESKT